MIKNTSYDTICHEHLEYYSLKSIKFIFDKVGFVITDLDFNDINGITNIQALFISFNTSSTIKCDFDPPPPITTLSGCIKFWITFFQENV